MARRDYSHTDRGKLYCIEWPEWHVECGHAGCSEATIVVSMGEATTLGEAEKRANSDRNEMEDGWKKKCGIWFCPKHA